MKRMSRSGADRLPNVGSDASRNPDAKAGEASIPEQMGLELWGGVECTVNRVGDRYFDQLHRNGHHERLSDLDLFAGLGIKAIRYPVIWERVAPHGLASADWTWTDQRLNRLRELGIRPIVGLIHHGSGPVGTDLLEPHFPDKLAEFAAVVAHRYPWVDAYTPVNEPLTTARFSALYGHWYPHRQDGNSFSRALLNQCRAVSLAMAAIREVNPKAQLVQTDDLGKTYSTPRLQYQAEFENERRWLTWDLLCGMVDEDHMMWDHLVIREGIEPAALEWFHAHRCPPDVIGVNHYLTSERFLDQHYSRYPASTHGGNSREAYADTEVVRVDIDEPTGLRPILSEAWHRYELPLAITEAHLGCTRDEQVRWLHHVWKTCVSARADGADVRAVTAWSLLGAFDWDSLLTRNAGHYEPGVYDIRGGSPRPTAIARLMVDLGSGTEPQDPVLGQPGWWERPARVLYPRRRRLPAVPSPSGYQFDGRPLLITGGTGTLGRAFARICDARALPYRLTRRHELDIAQRESVDAMLDRERPWAVVNTAGYVRVDDAEADEAACMRENAHGAIVLAAACAARGIPFVTFSSDLVFDGSKTTPYVESDAPAPLNVYGRSKAEAEWHVLSQHPGSLVIRTSAFFGPWDDYNFVTVALRELEAGKSFAAASDGLISPTYVPDLVHASLDLMIDGEVGVWHVANPNSGIITWAEFARKAAALASVSDRRLQARPTEIFGWPAWRPVNTVLGSERGVLLPPLDDALVRYFRERKRTDEAVGVGCVLRGTEVAAIAVE